MQIIGITGGIGSGKSTIAKELARRGFVVYDCDAEAKRIIAANAQVRQAIESLLGKDAFTDNRYNTAYVAKHVFAKPELLAQLNAIIHPAVKQDILQKKPDFIESAILYEADLDTICKSVIVVDAPEQIRIERTIARDYNGQATPENIHKVRARMCAQKPHTGDLLINNDGRTSIQELVEKITQWMCKN